MTGMAWRVFCPSPSPPEERHRPPAVCPHGEHGLEASRANRPAGGAAAVALVAAMALALGAAPSCKRVTPPPAKPSADELWSQAEAALDDGQVERSAELFGESLAASDDAGRRIDAAIRVAVAGRLDLGEALVANRPQPELATLARAMKIFRESPPSGRAKDVYTVAAMADALWVLRAPMTQAETPRPIRLSPRHLADISRAWQKWQWYRQAFSVADSQPADQARAMVLWLLAQTPPATDPPGAFIMHGTGEEGPALALVHLGSWPLDETSPAYDVAAFARLPAEGPAGFCLAAWRTGQAPSVLLLAGRLREGELVVTSTSDESAYGALVNLLADASISPGRVVPRSQQERAEILSAAERLGFAGRLGQDGSAIVDASAVDPEDAAAAPAGEWLSDLAGYIRYGK